MNQSEQNANLIEQLQNRLDQHIQHVYANGDMPVIEVLPEHLLTVALALRDEGNFAFELLLDICGVDYQDYGVSYWEKESATARGFSRAVLTEGLQKIKRPHARFASIYHLLSLQKNQRLRIKVFLEESNLKLPSVVSIWPAANWYEREAFDLFGIVYENHPDLRRILTDYGFKGHPFRKDFPLIGEVEMRYDATEQRCIYEPVSIQPRTLVPKVIPRDPRYDQPEEQQP